MSADWGSHGVRLNAVAPGNVRTAMTDALPPIHKAAVEALPVPTNYGADSALMDPVDIANAKLAVCKDGFNAWVYGKPIGGELAWLLMQARSRTPSQEERALLDPISRLIAQKKSVREEEADYE